MDDNWHIDKSAHLDLVGGVVTETCGPCGAVRLLHTWGPTIVAAADLSDGRTVVLKASGRQDMHAEAEACRLAARAGVPVPEVLAVGRDDGMPGGRWYLMSGLPGVAWNSLPAEEAFDAAVLDQLAECFARLHATTGTRFGSVAEPDGSGSGSWVDWLRRGFAADLELLAAGGAETGRLSGLAEDSLSRLESELELRPCALVHADLGDGEVFVDPDSGRVTGLADWGSAVFGDPLYDFARFVAGGPVDDERPPRFLPRLRAAYARLTGVDWDRFEPLTELYDAHNAVSNAAWASSEGVDWVPSLSRKAQNLLSGIVSR